MMLTEEISACIQAKLLAKLRDPDSFTLPCKIGEGKSYRALCDLGVSINLMTFSIFKTLGLGELRPTTMNLQLADCSMAYPRGIIEDVLVKVDKFIFPVDFVVLDMKEGEFIPLILGRLFLVTKGAVIDVKKWELVLNVNDDHILFNIYKVRKFHEEDDDGDEEYMRDHIHTPVKEQVEMNSKIEVYGKIGQEKEPSKLEIKDLEICKSSKFGGVFPKNTPNLSKSSYASFGVSKMSMTYDMIEEPDGLLCDCFDVLKK
ncbi:hypothetical protein ACS0TY_010581 [Phlomoides rotata]